MTSPETVAEEQDELEPEGADETVEEEGPDLDAPLELLNSVTARLLRGEIPTNQNRLQSLFQHLQSVVGDVVDASFAKITSAFDEVEEANEALREELGDTEETEEYLQEFELGREHIEEALSVMQDTFFSAQNIDDLEDFEDQFREAEVQLAEGLSRLEMALMKADSPELFEFHEGASVEFVGEAADALAMGLEALSAHLEDGRASHLEFVLDRLDQAREFVEAALAEAEEEEPEEDELNSEEFDEDDYQPIDQHS